MHQFWKCSVQWPFANVHSCVSAISIKTFSLFQEAASCLRVVSSLLPLSQSTTGLLFCSCRLVLLSKFHTGWILHFLFVSGFFLQHNNIDVHLLLLRSELHSFSLLEYYLLCGYVWVLCGFLYLVMDGILGCFSFWLSWIKLSWPFLRVIVWTYVFISFE